VKFFLFLLLKTPAVAKGHLAPGFKPAGMIAHCPVITVLIALSSRNKHAKT